MFVAPGCLTRLREIFKLWLNAETETARVLNLERGEFF